MGSQPRGMLLNFMDYPDDGTADFHRWYDTEHLQERVGIPGFRGASRYEALDAGERWLATYDTDSFGVLTSGPYLEALGRQSDWSRRTMARFQQGTRALGRVRACFGAGQGGTIAFIRLAQAAFADRDAGVPLVALIQAGFGALLRHDGVHRARLVETLPPGEAAAGSSSDWFVIVDASDPGAAVTASDELRLVIGSDAVRSAGLYRLRWTLSRGESCV